jgi:hypothetical protein
MAEFYRVPGVLAALAIAVVLSAFAPWGDCALAQSGASGVADSASDDMPDFPIPSSAHEAYSPIGEGFETPIEPRADLKAAKPSPQDEARLRSRPASQDARPFFRDTELYATSRTYWLKLDDFSGKVSEALTTGGYISYQSGYAGDVLQLRGVLYTTQPLYAPEGAGRTLNLTPDGDQITTLGQANARLKFAGQEFSAGRQLVRTAFINPKDNRMIPLTFEGLVLVPQGPKNAGLDYIASYLWRYKPRDTADFIPFSRPFGVAQDEGVLINGIRTRRAASTMAW